MGPPSRSQLFLREAIDVIGCTTILGAFHGIAFTLYCLCARSCYLQLQVPDKRRQARFTLGYISLVLFCATAILALNTRMIQSAYINHSDYPGGPLGYEASYESPTSKSYGVIGGTFTLIVEVLTTAIQIWRLRIIWSGTQYAVAVTVLPLILLLAYIALDIPTGIARVVSPIDQLGISVQSAIATDISSFAVPSAFTILVTGLITARILLVRRRNIRLMGTSDASSSYMGIVAMLIESYALESAWSIASAISLGLDDPSSYLFVTNDPTIKVIAYFLVVYRVASGRAWTRNTEHELTSLQWHHGTQTATDEASSIYSRVPAAAVAVAVDSQSVSHSESAV